MASNDVRRKGASKPLKQLEWSIGETRGALKRELSEDEYQESFFPDPGVNNRSYLAFLTGASILWGMTDNTGEAISTVFSCVLTANAPSVVIPYVGKLVREELLLATAITNLDTCTSTHDSSKDIMTRLCARLDNLSANPNEGPSDEVLALSNELDDNSKGTIIETAIMLMSGHNLKENLYTAVASLSCYYNEMTKGGMEWVTNYIDNDATETSFDKIYKGVAPRQYPDVDSDESIAIGFNNKGKYALAKCATIARDNHVDGVQGFIDIACTQHSGHHGVPSARIMEEVGKTRPGVLRNYLNMLHENENFTEMVEAVHKYNKEVVAKSLEKGQYWRIFATVLQPGVYQAATGSETTSLTIGMRMLKSIPPASLGQGKTSIWQTYVPFDNFLSYIAISTALQAMVKPLREEEALDPIPKEVYVAVSLLLVDRLREFYNNNTNNIIGRRKYERDKAESSTPLAVNALIENMLITIAQELDEDTD